MFFEYLRYAFNSLSWSSIFTLLVYLFILFSIISVIRSARRKLKLVHSHWHHYMETVPFSPQEFYEAVEDAIENEEIPMVQLSRISYPQGGIFSADRIYLRVKCREYVFDICAAPFAKGFFISWWMGEIPDAARDFFANMPWIGIFFQKRQKTFFELDNEALFKESVSHTVKKVYEALTENKGLRKLTDAEWMSINKAI